jgi:hypothetical protein
MIAAPYDINEPRSGAVMAGTDDLLRAVAEGTARHLGQDFLLAMVRALHDAMEVSLAIVTQGVGKPITRARPLHYWRSGWDGEVVEYDLSETGCARVYGGEDSVGLGLSIVRAIAERHGGLALAESGGRGKGARFTLVLPRTADVSGPRGGAVAADA